MAENDPKDGLRARVHEWLEDEEADARPAVRRLRGLLASWIVIAVAAAVLGTVPSLPRALASAIAAIEATSLVLFSAEYLLRLWSIVEDRSGRYAGAMRGRLRWAVTPLALVDLLSVLPFWLGGLFGADTLVLRLFRVLRLLKLARHSRALEIFELVLLSERRALAAVFALMLAILLIAATVLHVLEADVQPEGFGSIPAALWWAVATLTTVGYGDVVPVTPAGRFVAAILSLLGISMFALPTAVLGAAFVREMQAQSFTEAASLVARVPLFRSLDVARLAELVSLLRVRRLPAGYRLLRRGERSDAMYFLVEGRLVVRGGRHRRILEPGAFFGELSLVEERPRAVTVTAIEPSRLLELRAADFHRLLAGDPELRAALLAEARSRLAVGPTERTEGDGSERQPRSSSGTNGRSTGPV